MSSAPHGVIAIGLTLSKGQVKQQRIKILLGFRLTMLLLLGIIFLVGGHQHFKDIVITDCLQRKEKISTGYVVESFFLRHNSF